MLWNEFAKDPEDPKKEIPLSADRIQQIWFSGVHSNVGGGYADDGLAYVSLDWMMEEAGRAGLRFTEGRGQGINGAPTRTASSMIHAPASPATTGMDRAR